MKRTGIRETVNIFLSRVVLYGVFDSDLELVADLELTYALFGFELFEHVVMGVVFAV